MQRDSRQRGQHGGSCLKGRCIQLQLLFEMVKIVAVLFFQQASENAILAFQLSECSMLDNLTAPHDKDLIHLAERAEPMRYGDDCAPMNKAMQCVHYLRFRLHIKIGSWLIEKKNR